MSEFHVVVVKIGKIFPHSNADSLEITEVHGGYPCIIRKGAFKEGDLAAYAPIDSLCPTDRPYFSFLAKPEKPRPYERIKALRLRGVFSMGLLIPLPDKSWVEGQNVQAELGIEKWEPPAEKLSTGGENESDPGFLPIYTDIEGIRRWPNILIPGEEVAISEKIHGANGRWLWRDGRLWVGSHKNIKRESDKNLWWMAAKQMALPEKLATIPNIAFYGEVFGQVQDLQYAIKGVTIAFFDALDTDTRRYLDYDDFVSLTDDLELPRVPLLYRGPWNEDCRKLAEGQTTMLGANHVREGVVIRPVRERWNEHTQRTILKLVGEGYLLRKQRD